MKGLQMDYLEEDDDDGTVGSETIYGDIEEDHPELYLQNLKSLNPRHSNHFKILKDYVDQFILHPIKEFGERDGDLYNFFVEHCLAEFLEHVQEHLPKEQREEYLSLRPLIEERVGIAVAAPVGVAISTGVPAAVAAPFSEDGLSVASDNDGLGHHASATLGDLEAEAYHG